jgi:hypothetical protein
VNGRHFLFDLHISVNIALMTSFNLVEFLNRRVYHDQLQQHWSKQLATNITEVLGAIDPIGIASVGEDEYEPEALLIIAFTVGLLKIDELWSVFEPPFFSEEDITPLTVMVSCCDAFREMFERDCEDVFTTHSDNVITIYDHLRSQFVR